MYIVVDPQVECYEANKNIFFFLSFFNLHFVGLLAQVMTTAIYCEYLILIFK